MKSLMWLLVAGVLVLMVLPSISAQDEDWEEILDIVSGKVASLDTAGNKLTITDMEGQSQVFALDPNLTTVWDDTADEEKEIGDLEVGKEVVVEFRVDDDGGKIASWIDIVAVSEEIPVVVDEEVVEVDEIEE